MGKGKLSVRIKSGKHLPAKDMNGKSDPYVVLKLGKQKEKTKVIKANLNPTWNEHFSLKVTDHESEKLVLQVYDYDLVGRNEEMGFIDIPLNKLPIGKEESKSYPLHGSKTGEILVELRMDIEGHVSAAATTGLSSSSGPSSSSGLNSSSGPSSSSSPASAHPTPSSPASKGKKSKGPKPITRDLGLAGAKKKAGSAKQASAKKAGKKGASAAGSKKAPGGKKGKGKKGKNAARATRPSHQQEEEEEAEEEEVAEIEEEIEEEMEEEIEEELEEEIEEELEEEVEEFEEEEEEE